MAYENLKSAIKQAIKQNGNQEITGNLLQNTLLNIVNTLGAEYKFLGFANSSTVPPTSEEGRLLYFTTGHGDSYMNFPTSASGSYITLGYGIYALTREANSKYWRSDVVVPIAQESGTALDKVMSQKAVKTELDKKIDKASIVQESGNANDKVMSQGAIKTELDKKIDKAELDKKIDKASIVQESGNANDKVMSQKAVTDQLSILNVFTLFPIRAGYIRPDGTYINDYNWICTDFIRIKNDITISANIVEQINGTAAILFFDANKKVISKVDSTLLDNNKFGFINSANITPPDNAKYMRCCAPTTKFVKHNIKYYQNPQYVTYTGLSTHIVTEAVKTELDKKIDKASIVQESGTALDKIMSQGAIKTELDKKMDKENISQPIYTKHVLLNMKSDAKILLYGDSISSTDYNGYKQAMIQHSGLNNVYNAGFSGYTTNALAKDAQLQRIFDYSPDIIIIQCGGNDNGVTVGTFDKNNKSQVLVSETDISKDYSGSYFIQALDHIVRKLKNKYYNLVERANLSGLETSAEKIQKIDAVKQVYIAVITPLPQKRNNAASVWSQEKNWENKRNAVIEVCNKNNIHCIDVYKNWGVDMSKEPFWSSPTDKINQNGIYTMDGLHPSNAGYKKIVELITGEINIKIS